AVANCREAIRLFVPGSPDAAGAIKLHAEALALMWRFGFQPATALDEAIGRYDEAAEMSDADSVLGRAAQISAAQLRLQRLDRRASVRAFEQALTFTRPGRPDHAEAVLKLVGALLFPPRPDAVALDVARQRLALLGEASRLPVPERIRFYSLLAEVAWRDRDC